MAATAVIEEQIGRKVKFLNHLEVFFMVASPSQHLELIEYWLELVLTDQYYNRNNAPSDLLDRHQVYLALLEQVFEFIESEGLELGGISTSEEYVVVLQREAHDFSYFPIYLYRDMLLRPSLVLTEIANAGNLQQYKSWLYDWLIEGLNGHSGSEAFPSIFPLYRVMKQLIEACWLIHSRETKKAEGIHSHTHELQPLIGFITAIVPAEYIFCLSYRNGYVDLMVVLDKDCGRSFTELEPLLEFAALGFPKITCTLHTVGMLNDVLLRGRLYYLRVCRAETCVYCKTGAQTLPFFDKDLLDAAEKSAQPIFEAGIGRATAFYKGASNYLRLGETAMAVFMLQQVCELSYRTLLLVLRGKEIKTHDLMVLRKHLRRYYPAIVGTFSDVEDEELRLLSILDTAYIEARYGIDFKISAEDLAVLHERVWYLLEEMKLVFGAP